MTVDSFAHFCLKFGHITFILPFVILFMTFHKRELYAKAICFLFFIMIWNTLLKHIFKIPLFSHLGNGYAFPSGHMHAAAIFYGYILYRINNKLIKILISALLIFFGFSLVHCRFHDLFDVVGAVGFATIEIYIYHLIKCNFGEKTAAITSVIGSIIIMIALSEIYKIEFHVWLAFYALVGTMLSMMFIPDNRPEKIPQKFIAIIVCAILISSLHFVFKIMDFKTPAISEMKFILLPVIVMSSINWSSKIKI